MSITIINSKVMYHQDFFELQIFIYAKYSDQSTSTINELGQGTEDAYSFEYELPNKTIIILWK